MEQAGNDEADRRPGQVKIKMLAGGVCGSDLAAIARGDDCPSYPWTIGHEGGGLVVECAPDVTGLAAGDLVVIEPNYICGTCYWCERGETKMCENRLVFETSGTPAGFTTALERAQKLADICLIGQTTKPTPLALRPIVQKEVTIRGHLTYSHPRDFAAAAEKVRHAPEEPIGLRPPANRKQAVQDIREVRSLPGKIWIDLEDWD